MNQNKKYIVARTARDILVGLTNEQTAEEDINLAHNLFNSHVNHNYYHGVINFNTLNKFYRFLINKHLLKDWDSSKPFSQLLKKATNKARSVINNDVEHHDFVTQIYQREVATAHRYAVRLNNK